MNIQNTNLTCRSQNDPQPQFTDMIAQNETTLVHTFRIRHLDAQDLVALQSQNHAPSALFQKRDRSLKNPSYTILALDAALTVSITNNSVEIEGSTRQVKQMQLPGCPFEFLNALHAAQTSAIEYNALPADIAFASGMIGYLGFGLTSQIEKIEKQESNPLSVPDSRMMLPQTIVYIDHQNASAHVISRAGAERFHSIVQKLESRNNNSSQANRRSQAPTQHAPSSATNTANLTASMSKQDFLDKAIQAKRLIEEGQCFQIVLSQRFSAPISTSAAEMFSTLLATAPSTYNYFLNFPDFQYIGASPETMVSTKAGQVRLCALAGTRPRGTTQTQDDNNEIELRTNEKELAEHLMLVDLGRNDLGKVCVPGSIKVGPIAQVLKYSNVMHLGTEIFGVLESNNNPFKALKACFPRGTVSGAPKVRALELLSKLEPEQRGIYAGAVGFFDGRGNMDTAIAIRSALIKDNFIHINAGAGIVYDSVPEFEYMETINKASAIASVFQQVQLEDELHIVRAGAN